MEVAGLGASPPAPRPPGPRPPPTPITAGGLFGTVEGQQQASETSTVGGEEVRGATRTTLWKRCIGSNGRELCEGRGMRMHCEW